MKQRASFKKLLLKFLLTRKGGNRLLFAYMDDMLGKDSWSRGNFYTVVSRLQHNALIQKEKDEWVITQSGRDYIRSNRARYTPGFIDSPFKKDAKKDLLIIFDVPEDKKLYRDWLREQLKIFRYSMIQKSVWRGPFPLPKKFDQYLREMGIKKCLQSFRLK